MDYKYSFLEVFTCENRQLQQVGNTRVIKYGEKSISETWTLHNKTFLLITKNQNRNFIHNDMCMIYKL